MFYADGFRYEARRRDQRLQTDCQLGRGGDHLGYSRKPGMTRGELIGTNANIMKGVIENVVKYSPARSSSWSPTRWMPDLSGAQGFGLPKNRIIGMGGALDSARFKCYLAKSHRRQHQQRGRHGDRRSWRYDDDSAAFEGFGQWRARDAIRLEEET